MLPFVLTSVVFIILGGYIALGRGNWLGILLIFLFLPILQIPAHLCTNPPINDYPYEARVTIANNKQSSDIYFTHFTQEGNTVTITPYAKIGWRWIGLEQWNVYDAPLTIILTNPDNKFIYKDRLTRVTINEEVHDKDTPIFATQ